MSPAWLRIGGIDADYVTFVPPYTVSHTRDINDNEDEMEDHPLEFSGIDELDTGRNAERFKPELNSIQNNSENPGVHCQMEESQNSRTYDNNVSPVPINLLPYEWDRVHRFVKKVGWKIVFTLNVQLRNYTEWDVSNAASLIDYTEQRGYKTSWALGNGILNILNIFITSFQSYKILELHQMIAYCRTLTICIIMKYSGISLFLYFKVTWY